MINGVLVERTVSDVLPALQTNADGLKKVLEDLVKQYRTKQEEMEKWKVRADHVLSWLCLFRRDSTDTFVEKEQCSGGAAITAELCRSVYGFPHDYDYRRSRRRTQTWKA